MNFIQGSSDLDTAHLTADDWIGLPAHSIPHADLISEKTIAIVPDFLTYARWISGGRAMEIVARSGSLGFLSGATRSAFRMLAQPSILTRRGMFEIAQTLIDYDLGLLLGRGHHAKVLHPYVADLAIATEQVQFLRRWFSPSPDGTSKRGIWTHRTGQGLTLITRLGIRPSVWVHPGTTHRVEDRIALEQVRRVGGPMEDTQFVELKHVD